MVKGRLTLKRELAPKAEIPPIGSLTVAHLWVDASVFHLDTPFSYLIPGDLADQVKVGSFVSVPFHGREVIGLVVGLSELGALAGLKRISKVIGRIPLITEDGIELISDAAEHFAAHPFDLIRSAIPDRVVSIEREFDDIPDSYTRPSGTARGEYLQLPPHQNRSQLIAKKIAERSRDGGVLVILPDSGEVERLATELAAHGSDFSILDSKLGKSELYRNFLQVRLGQVRIAIGTRSAIFAPVSDLKTIAIFNEGSEHLYERRSPGWNARDIALLRARRNSLNLLFIGYSPSSEIAQLIEEGRIEYRRSRSKVKVSSLTSDHGELLPSRAIAPLRQALKSGPILFVVPLKGYAQAIRCAQCRTISRCQCGGAHEKLSLSAPITCNHCLTEFPLWRCAWCHSQKLSIQSRGADRHHHEIGLLFSGVKTFLSTSDHPIKERIDGGILVATPGMAPLSTDGYAAVIFLESNRFLNQPDLRASERVREMFFSHSALAAQSGTVMLIGDEGDAIGTALTTWNPITIVQRELEERKSLSLPPYVRAVKLSMEPVDITRLQSALIAAREEGRIPIETKILGPISIGDKSSLILTVSVEVGDVLVSTIHEFIRRRSIAKKSMPSLRIDPYSLSH